MNFCVQCQRPLIGRQLKYCTRCINADKNNHRTRRDKVAEMFVSVDTEGNQKIDGIMRCTSVSYGREDGVSDSMSAYPGEWLTGQEVIEWLIEETSGHFIDADGKEWKPAHVAFHFGYDIAVLCKDFDPTVNPDVELSVIYKATARDRNQLCNTRHKQGMTDPCTRMHRYDETSQQMIITDGGEGDLLTYDAKSNLAIATSNKRRFYAEYRPCGDDMTGNRRVDIHDTGTAFTGGLEASLAQWQPELSEAQHAAIKWGKQARLTGFVGATNDEIEAYSEAECVGHARMCRMLIDSITEAGHIPIKPGELYGSGSIAGAALTYYGVAKRKHTMVTEKRAKGFNVEDLPTLTYFGGLIEAPVLGQLSVPVDEVDINSAYPSHMLSLPCMREGHGDWVSRPGSRVSEVPTGSLGYVEASWNVETETLPPFMVRTKAGLVREPLTGSRIWVSLPEYETAVQRFPYGVTAHHVVYYQQGCKCENPLLFLSDLYDKRAGIKAEMKLLEDGSDEWQILNCRQAAIKLVINSIYGKFAQRRPTVGTFTNMHYASHITGCTRAQVRREAWLREDQGGTIVYTHTDSVLSIGGNPVSGGNALGAWGLEKQSFNLTIVQPGLAVSMGSGKTASRGCSKDKFREGVEKWLETTDLTQPPHTWPPVQIERTMMLSRRLAMHEGHPDLAGNFTRRDLSAGFRNSRKRDILNAVPIPGNPRAWRVPPCKIVYEDEVATLEDIKTFETELSARLKAGDFDNG